MSEHCQGCQEYLALSRRQFLGATGAGVLALSVPEWLPTVSYAQDACTDRDVAVVIFLRGAADGLTLCVPYGDDAYYAARPTLAIPRPDTTDPNRVTNLDGFFGFPPAMTPLIPAYQDGHLLMVHASGSPSGSRSHFDAMRFMEFGKPGDNTIFTGWLGRHLSTAPPLTPNPVLRAIGIGYGLQQSLLGGPLSLPIPQLDAYDLAGDPITHDKRLVALRTMYAATTDPLLTAAQTAQATINFLKAINFDGYVPAGGTVYPNNTFAFSLMSTAALIKAEVGVEAVAIDVPGWDTHNAQGVDQGGDIWTLMTTLAGGLAAFYADVIAGSSKNVTVMVMSEFGRRVHENGSLGTDHGHGNCMFLMGKNIAGGRILRNWPGLQDAQLFQGLDLDVTIDYRDVLAEIVQYRLQNPNISTVFPGYTPTLRGVTKSCPGDLNCDNLVNTDDVPSFVSAVMDPANFPGNGTRCGSMNADMNNDGVVDGRDIQQFVRSVLGQ